MHSAIAPVGKSYQASHYYNGSVHAEGFILSIILKCSTKENKEKSRSPMKATEMLLRPSIHFRGLLKKNGMLIQCVLWSLNMEKVKMVRGEKSSKLEVS